METLSDAIDKKMSKGLCAFLDLVDPARMFFSEKLVSAWNQLTLNDQRKLYLYLLYRKWRGINIYGEPFFIIHNCHPVPFNWNGSISIIENLIRENKMVIAKYNGSFGAYTRDEAKLYEMTDVEPLNPQKF